ncbi:hypothetical protein STEG23_032999 [Scotinomys teguina]
MDLLGQRTHCGPNVAAPNPRQPYLGDFTADGLDQLTLCSQSPGFGTPAAPVQAQVPKGTPVKGLHGGWARPADTLLAVAGLRHNGSTCAGDFTADGLDQLTLCSQSQGFGTPAAPVQGHPKSVLSCRHRRPGRLFSLPNNLALSLRCRRRFQEAPLSSEQAVLLQPSPAQPSPAQPSPGTMSQRCDTESGDFTADGLDQLTLCSQSPGFGTPAAPVQGLFKETESGQSTRVSKLTIISPDTERK